MEDLRETTHYKHYEVFRRERLAQMGFADSVDGMPVRCGGGSRLRVAIQLAVVTRCVLCNSQSAGDL